MWEIVSQCSTALGLVFSLALGTSYRYVWCFAHSEQRIWMSFPYVTLHFWMITVTLETNKATHMISSRMFITQRRVPGQRSCLRQAIAQQNAFTSVVYKLSQCTAHLHRVLLFCFVGFFFFPWNSLFLKAVLLPSLGIFEVRCHLW